VLYSSAVQKRVQYTALVKVASKATVRLAAVQLQP
jgi:hypothetical protein